MTKNPIIVMPAATPETYFARDTALAVIRMFRDRGFKPVTLNGFGTMRPGFSRALEWVRNLEEPPHLLVYFGHGFQDSLLGIKQLGIRSRQLRPVVAGEPFDNAGILHNFITYAVACDSLSILGKEAVEKGALAYYSNNKPLFVLQSDLNRNNVPDFQELFSVIPYVLGRGGSTYEAMNYFTAKLNEMGQYAIANSYEQRVILDIKQDFGMIGQDVRYV